MQDSYAELAFAILFWDRYNRTGTRAQQIDTERTLHLLAQELMAIGYKLGEKK